MSIDKKVIILKRLIKKRDAFDGIMREIENAWSEMVEVFNDEKQARQIFEIADDELLLGLTEIEEELIEKFGATFKEFLIELAERRPNLKQDIVTQF